MQTNRQRRDRIRIGRFCEEQNWDVTCRCSKSGYTLRMDDEPLVRLRATMGWHAFDIEYWDGGQWQPLSEPGRPMPLPVALEYLAENASELFDEEVDDELIGEADPWAFRESLQDNLLRNMPPGIARQMIFDMSMVSCISGAIGVMLGNVVFGAIAGILVAVAYSCWMGRRSISWLLIGSALGLYAPGGIVTGIVSAQFEIWTGGGIWWQLAGMGLAVVVTILLSSPVGMLLAGLAGACLCSVAARWLNLPDFWHGVVVTIAAWLAGWLYYSRHQFFLAILLQRSAAERPATASK